MNTKERPILFNGDMVRALLDGRKTVTRRVVKLPDAPSHLGEWEPTVIGGRGVTRSDGTAVPEQPAIWHTRTGKTLVSPYGQPGDRLWVRESFKYAASGQITDKGGGEPSGDIRYGVSYKADGTTVWNDTTTKVICVSGGETGPMQFRNDKWKPSIHMPHTASRITLEITDVRVERVQDISEDDAKAEGCGTATEIELWPPDTGGTCSFEKQTYTAGFRDLWDSINGKEPGRSWPDNPWVWVVSFDVVT